MQNVEDIIFDCGGVLVDLTPDRCFEAFDELGFDMRPYLNPYAQGDIFSQVEKGLTSVDELCNQIRAWGGQPDLSNDAICAAWISFISTIPRERLEMLRRLSERYTLYVLSNINVYFWERIANLDFLLDGESLLPLFKHSYLSFELHQQKPDKEIFDIVLQSGEINPSSTLFIDDYWKNCEVARTLNFQTYCPKPAGNWVDWAAENLL